MLLLIKDKKIERFKKNEINPKFMDRNLAERLVEELEMHPPLSSQVLKREEKDINKLVDALVATEVPPSKRFHEQVHPNNIYIHDAAMELHHFVSIRRILRNDQARNYRLSTAKAWYEYAASTLGIHDSDIWTRKLRSNDDLIRMMAQSPLPYSLLGKIETFEDSSRKVAIRPIVIIPEAHDSSKIREWEDANTAYGKEDLIGFRRLSERRFHRP